MCLAVPGRVLEVEERDGTRMATVDFGGVVKDVCLAYLPDIDVGDYTIVHVGFAIQRLDEESALETLRTFEQLGMLEEEFGDAWGRAAAEAGHEPPADTRTPDDTSTLAAAAGASAADGTRAAAAPSTTPPGEARP